MIGKRSIPIETASLKDYEDNAINRTRMDDFGSEGALSQYAEVEPEAEEPEVNFHSIEELKQIVDDEYGV